MDKQTFSLQLSLKNITSGSQIPYEPMGRAGIETWQAACDLLSRHTYFAEQGKIEIATDWRSLRDKFEKIVSFETLPIKERTKYLLDLMQDDEKALQINFDLTLPESLGKTEEGRQNIALHYLELFLYEFFLAMNLASPGCCDFYTAIIPSDTLYLRPIGLSAVFVEIAWHEAIKGNWPIIQPVPLIKVIAWLQTLNLGSHQIAKTRTERALFALLHLSRKEQYNPEGLIWIAHALEALYDLPEALITRSLQDRVCMVLGIPQEQHKRLRKSLRSFYDTRSSFVHGSMEIAHPLENERLDVNASAYVTNLMEAINFGACILTSTLQWHILNGYKEVNFSESFVGMPN